MTVTGASVTALIEAALARLDQPATKPGRVLRGFKIATVFDIAQTEGDPIEPPPTPGLSDVDAVTCWPGRPRRACGTPWSASPPRTATGSNAATATAPTATSATPTS